MESLSCLTCKKRQELVAEVVQLRRMWETRPVIDMAKGIIIAERRCSPEAAFSLLQRISNETNTKLYEVAKAILDQATA